MISNISVTNISGKTRQLYTHEHYKFSITIDVEYKDNKYYVKSQKLYCANENDETDTHEFDIHLPMCYKVDENIKSMKDVKNQLNEDIYREICSLPELDVDSESINVDIKINANLSKLPPINTDDKCKHFRKIKFEYTEDYSSVCNYLYSLVFGKVNKEECEKHKPFYLVICADKEDIGYRMDNAYEKIKPIEDNGRLYATIKGYKMVCDDSIQMFYNEKEDGVFEIINVISPDHKGINGGRLESMYFYMQLIRNVQNFADKLYKGNFTHYMLE